MSTTMDSRWGVTSKQPNTLTVLLMNVGYTAFKQPDILLEGEFKCDVVDQLIGQQVLRETTVVYVSFWELRNRIKRVHANKLHKETLPGKQMRVATTEHAV